MDEIFWEGSQWEKQAQVRFRLRSLAGFTVQKRRKPGIFFQCKQTDKSINK